MAEQAAVQQQLEEQQALEEQALEQQALEQQAAQQQQGVFYPAFQSAEGYNVPGGLFHPPNVMAIPGRTKVQWVTGLRQQVIFTRRSAQQHHHG